MAKYWMADTTARKPRMTARASVRQYFQMPYGSSCSTACDDTLVTDVSDCPGM